MTILERWFEEVCDDGNEAAIDDLMVPGVIIHNFLSGNGEKSYDAASLKTMLRSFRPELSEVHVQVEHQMTEGQFSAALCHHRRL